MRRLRRAPVAQLDRALACGAKGREFESRRVYQIRKQSQFYTYRGTSSETQRRGGIALLAPIRPNEKLHVELDLERVGVPHNREFKPASTEGEVLELAVG